MPLNLEVDLANIATRLQRLEDELALQRLIVTYGLAVDCSDIDAALACHLESAEYIVSAARPGMPDLILKGHDEIGEMLRGPLHQSLVPDSAHTIGPVITEDHDHSYRATGYSRLYHQGALMRIAINQWQFAPSSSGFKIARRISRVVGEEKAQELLREHFAMGQAAF